MPPDPNADRSSPDAGAPVVGANRTAAPLRSMTGFARVSGRVDDALWAWELKSVNGKGLDARVRTPTGFDAVEIEARRRIAARLARGTCQATLSVVTPAAGGAPQINLALLSGLMATLSELRCPAAIGPVTLDGLLSVRGVVEAGEPAPYDEALQQACLGGLDQALDALVAARGAEGSALALVLTRRLDAIAALTAQADAAPERRPDAIRARLERAIAALTDRPGLDPERLHQEALLLAAKADVREELDRLHAHIASARSLLAEGGPVGRRLDFLAQELGREASTFCAKVNDPALATTGLELRVEIEQFREQIQNIE